MQSCPTSERRPTAGAYPRGVGSKFHPDGSVRGFAGNTVICHLPEASPLRPPLLQLHDRLRRDAPATLYTLLPPASWHMTVFEGACDQVRRAGFWPDDLAADAPMAACDALFAGKLAGFDPRLAPPLRLAVAGWRPLTDGLALHLQPATPADATGLRTLRDRLAERLRIRHPDHATYAFHLSLAYFIRHPSQSERRVLGAILDEALATLPPTFELGAPEFCLFDDMFAFRRQFFLDGPEAARAGQDGRR